MLDLFVGWDFDVQRGPDALFVHLSPSADQEWSGAPLADALWSLMQQHFAHRLVIECDQVDQVTAEFATQLAILQNKISENGGLLRLTGLSDANRAILDRFATAQGFPCYADLDQAMMAGRPRQAR